MIPNVLIRIVSHVVILGLLVACQPDQPGPERAEIARVSPVQDHARPAINALDAETAKARKARLADIEYDLSIDLADNSEQFSGKADIRFELSDPSADLTIDFAGGNIGKVVINDIETSVAYNDFFLTLPADSLQPGPNIVSISYKHPYDGDGTGLHRFVDPADGLTYLYTYLWPYYANRLFPVFDQPNLKAVITLNVRAPGDWVVVSTSNGIPTQLEDGSLHWQFSATPRMPTYVFSLHAGPYTVWEEDADGIPMRLMARQSLAEFVAVDEWFDVTRRGLAFFGQYFGIPYPYLKYDQLIVPDFNIGAMENIGAVTFTERYVQRQASSRSERERRVGTILHEMAHMWFGDLVTHEWWNGLWLNESFATQMAAISSLEVTEFDDTWHGFFTSAKREAYQADSRVTTHPIEVPVYSTADFFSVFDAITYEKGSSVLKQLAHYVGEENYRQGVSAYLKHFSYGNTELEDFIEFQSASAGIALQDWAQDWLYKPGFNTLSAESTCENGMLQSLQIVQTAPTQYPTLRNHRVDVALYNLDSSDVLVPSAVIATNISGDRSAVELPAGGLPCPMIVNPNEGDWTYAQISLDDQSVAILEQHLASIPDPLTRSIFLEALYGRAMTGDIPLAGYAEIAMRLAETESNIRIQQQISASLVETVKLMERLRPETDEALATLLPNLEQALLDDAVQASSTDVKYIWFNSWLAVVATNNGLEQVRGLLDGETQVAGLQISADIRWSLLQALSRSGAVDTDARLAAESAADVSDFAEKSALTVNAARPDRTSKEKWLSELRYPESVVGLAKQRAVMAGMFPPNQTTIQVELLGEILDSLPQVSTSSDPYFMSSYGQALLTPMCLPQSVELFHAALDSQADQLGSTALRKLREAHQADQECLALRALQ